MESRLWSLFLRITLPKVILAAALDPRTKALMGIPSNDQALIWELLEAEALALGVAVQIPRVQPVAVFEDNNEEARWNSAIHWSGGVIISTSLIC